MKANIIIGGTGIPQGFKLCNEEVIKHPVDNAWGALLQNETTGIYVHFVAGVTRSIDQQVAKELDKEINC